MPSINHGLGPRLVARLWSGRHAAVKVQLTVVGLLITLLNLGYYWQRELLDIALQQHLGSLIDLWDGVEWYAWVAVAPVGLALIRRFPLIEERPGRNLAGLVVGGLGLCVIVGNLLYGLRLLPNVWRPDSADLPFNWPTYLHTQSVLLPVNFVTFSGLIAVSFAVDYYFKYRQRAAESQQLELRTARLESELAKAQLVALRGQLQPHFLFNAFNAIATLVRSNQNPAAVETIAQLSALLRIAMESSGSPEVTLEQELDFATRYLEVERVRFGDKLRVSVSVPPEALPALVPSLVLQPLVGNAVKHAVARRATPGTVGISARRRESRLVLEVVDDGPGDAPIRDPVIRTGIGLANTRARLETSYRGDFRLEILPRAEGGTLVRLDLPWHTVAAAIEPSPTLA
jgi:two-component system, LytTR family, sensor kinase